MTSASITNKFFTDTFTLKKLGNSKYIIPTYQRPYVWDDEQINKLLDSFWVAFEKGEQTYFIGTVMTFKKDGNEELIDGQQRFTTLWLIAAAFKISNIDSLLTKFLKTQDNELRLDFAIRHQVKDFLSYLIKKGQASTDYTEERIQQDDYLKYIAKAIATIQSKLKQFKYNNRFTEKAFGDFIYERILFVKNTAPQKTNLNKLFTTINNSGVQLEQTDILKANLLNYLTDDRILYSKIWEACENMNNYFERNVRRLFLETNWSMIEKEDFAKFDSDRFLYKKSEILANSEELNNAKTLADILQNVETTSNNKQAIDNDSRNDSDEDTVSNCRSIITFGQLLLHTYRIYLRRKGNPDFELPFHVKNLLQIFTELKSERDIRGFIRVLWEVRYTFDKYVVKWISHEEREDLLLLTTVNKTTKNYFSRSIEEKKSETSMLQSLMYFTGNYNTQIWLSPYLKRLMCGENPIECLEQIDNQLSVSEMSDKDTTYILMSREGVVKENIDLEYYLNASHGTSFKHYWFQKLEYILWKNWEDRDNNKFKEYRITSKNSVEHVFPQNHEFGDKLDDETFDWLNSFGNLGLLSVSQNSSYSNQSVGKKKIDFDNKSGYDSLKLALIYNYDIENWDIAAIEEHQAEMINKIINHYNLVRFNINDSVEPM